MDAQTAPLPSNSGSVSTDTTNAPLQTTVDSPISQEIQDLLSRTQAAQLPPELDAQVQGILVPLKRSSSAVWFFSAYEEMVHYMHWITSFPWHKTHQDNLDLRHAQTVLNQNHYGLIPIKQRM